jgi:hypothetical protein
MKEAFKKSKAIGWSHRYVRGFRVKRWDEGGEGQEDRGAERKRGQRTRWPCPWLWDSRFLSIFKR